MKKVSPRNGSNKNRMCFLGPMPASGPPIPSVRMKFPRPCSTLFENSVVLLSFLAEKLTNN